MSRPPSEWELQHLLLCRGPGALRSSPARLLHTRLQGSLLDLRGAAIPRVRNPTPHMSTQGPNSVPDTAERLIRPQQVTLSLSQGIPSPRCPSPAPTVSPARHRLSCSSGVMWTLAGVRV